jgi:hypothetical protein
MRLPKDETTGSDSTSAGAIGSEPTPGNIGRSLGATQFYGVAEPRAAGGGIGQWSFP